MKKVLYETSPKFVDYGAKVRVCFDIEEVQIETEDEKGKKVTKTMYAAYTVYLSHPMTYDNIKAQLMGYGFDEFKSEEVAAEVMLYVVGENSEQALPLAKQMVIAKISQYDKSSAVNEFTYNNIPMWLDKDTRNGLLTRFNAEKAAGIESTTLWYGTQSFSLTVDKGIEIVNALELYASASYDKTSKHKANVTALETVEEVNSYDYTTGYPEKLNFNL